MSSPPDQRQGEARSRGAAPTTRRRGGGEDDSSTRSRMRDDLDVHDDAWASNDVVAAAGQARLRMMDNDDYDHDNDDDGGVRLDNRNALEARVAGASAPASSLAFVYRVTDPKSRALLGRRMTSREKREIKLRMKTEARPARGGEKNRLHEERIREVKRGNAESLQSRRTAQRGQTIMAGEKRG